MSKIISENEINESLQSTLKKSLCICFPKDIEVFSKVTYWRSIPSYRVIWEKDGNIISHIAVVDRSIAVAGEQIRVAGIQSVFVLPEYRGEDRCKEMFDLLIEEACQRKFDYSVLFCDPGLEKVYQQFGYKKLNDMQIIFTDEHGSEQELGSREIVMWCPVCGSEFPTGNISLNGDKW